MWSAVVAGGYLYFFAVILDNRHATVLGQFSYAAALIVVLGAAAVAAQPNTLRRR
jgi:hypothetical protein